MALEPIEFEKLSKYKPDYEFLRCGCGGIIGMYNRFLEACICDKCGKEFKLHEVPYDYLKINDKTGWIFPVIMRRSN